MEDPIVGDFGRRKCQKCSNVYNSPACQVCCEHPEACLEQEFRDGLVIYCQVCFCRLLLEEFYDRFEIVRKKAG
jgi:hypothetical protein